jgi:L-threonylcarbamoyladenylate synthase
MSMASDISKAARILRGGGTVAFPTETVYGLGADATNDVAVAKIFAAKQRPQFNPLISHVADSESAFRLGHFSSDAQKLAEAFWPGPLTLVVERQKVCPVSLLCSAGLSSIALRVPNHRIALELLLEADRPIAAPSANPSGRISPTTAEHVHKLLGDRVEMILDGGPCTVGVESSVVSFIDGGALLLRTGGVSRSALENILGKKIATPTHSIAKHHSPGQLESHYAPKARLRLDATEPSDGEVYLGFGSYQNGPYTLSAEGNLEEAAANLFKHLHTIDDSLPERIAVAPIPMTGLGEAINDRLRRAAAPRPSP